MKVFSKPVGEVKYFPVNKNNVCVGGGCALALQIPVEARKECQI